jgi:Tol biopolymer transport system component/predicted Ser/Thr protein kinase
MHPGLSISHYRVISKLGAGGMGEVWRATDTKLNRDVAIKILPEAFAADADRMARFQREAQVLASLNHPNIAQIYGIEDLALVMELVEGEPLRCPQPLETALDYARQIADALEAAHEKGITHRDLKPANIMVTPQGVVKVLDFGLAAVTQSSGGDPATSPTLTISPTQAGMILGTAAYMAPEQARGRAVDKRADIWAFGVVLYEMLTGEQLFAGATISDTLAAVLKTEVDLAPVPAQLRPIVERCLRKDARRRWRDIGDVRVALEEGLPAVAVTQVRHSWIPWALAGALALAFGGLAAIHFRETPAQPAAVRFQILPPEGGSLSDSFLALSPDGRRLAYTATAKGGQSLLWVRALDSLEARTLSGTEDARFPFWSPDSRFLAFWSGYKLKKIDASGGPAETLCNTSNIVGGDWNRDGTILVGASPGGISRAAQAGGDCVALTKPDNAHGETGHAHPQILPDGRHYLYLNVAAGESGIYLGSLDGNERKRLVSSSRTFGYAPPSEGGGPGHLLFVRDDTLMAQPFDPKSFASAGDPFPIAERIGSTGSSVTYASFSVSPNGVLAYRSGEGASNRQLTWLDRKGKPLGALSSRAPYIGVSLSRDGARAAVQKFDAQAGADIWLIDITRGIPAPFSLRDARTRYPVWSPDGGSIAFSSYGDGLLQLYRKDSSGARPEERLLKSSANERPCDWSRDGRFLMYTHDTDPGGHFALWVLSDPLGDPANRTAAPYLETTFRTAQCQFSPDGHWVAYTSDESPQGREIYVQSFPVPSSKFRVSSNGGVQPRWRRDGKELFYIAADRKLMAVDVTTAPTFQPGIPHMMFDSHVSGFLGGGLSTIVFNYDVTPDGQRFLINSVAESEGIAPEPITVILNWTAGLKK